MVRLLERFGLSHLCSTPMQIVAHTNMHTFVVLAGIRSISVRSDSVYGHPDFTPAQVTVSQKLHAQLVEALFALGPPQSGVRGWRRCTHARMPTVVRGTAFAHATAVVPELHAAFGSFQHFLQLAGCEKNYEHLNI